MPWTWRTVCSRPMSPSGLPPVAAGRFTRDSIPGVYIHATAVNNLLRGDALTEFGRWGAGLSGFLLAGLTAIDGATVLRRELPPSGLRRDGAAALYHRLPIPAGRHRIAVRLRDRAEGGFNHSHEQTVALAPGRSLLIDFAAARLAGRRPRGRPPGQTMFSTGAWLRAKDLLRLAKEAVTASGSDQLQPRHSLHESL